MEQAVVALSVIAKDLFNELDVGRRPSRWVRFVILDRAFAERPTVAARDPVRKCTVGALLWRSRTIDALWDRTRRGPDHGLRDECVVRGSGALSNEDVFRSVEGVAGKGRQHADLGARHDQPRHPADWA